MRDFNPPKDLLVGKVILITGAGDGIGRTAAESFAAHGATVILLGRTVAKLEAVYDAIVANGRPQPAIYPLNLTTANPQHYQELRQKLHDEFGRLDGLLHNAVEFAGLTPLEHYSVEQWYKVIQTNLNAVFLLTHACIPLLKSAPHGRLVFTNSESENQGKAFWGAHSVANFGCGSLMEVLADELENTRIRVNSIYPGSVRTKLRARIYPAENSANIVTPEVIMPTYLYLMSNLSEKVHGQYVYAQADTQALATPQLDQQLWP